MTENNDEMSTRKLENEAIQNVYLDAVVYAANAGPEYNYLAFSIYTLFIPELIKSHIALVNAALMQNPGMGVAWNILDAVYSIALGIYQFLQATPTPIESKVKGSTNVLSGAQLITLTFLGLGAPGFAAAFGLGFLHSAWDTSKLIRLYRNKALRDREKEVEKGFLLNLNKNITKKLHDIDEAIKTITTDPANTQNNSKHQKCQLWLELLQAQSKAHESKIDDRLKILGMDDSARKTELKKEIKQSLYNTSLWTVAFAGMLLACIPGCQIPALVLIGIATAMYIYRHIGELKHFAVQFGQAIRNHESLPKFLGTLFYGSGENKKEDTREIVGQSALTKSNSTR